MTPRQLMLQANWIQTRDTEAWLRLMAVGRTLNVCCGASLVGDVRVDIDPNSSRTEPGDLFNLHVPPLSFDTVICDPPFQYYVTGPKNHRFGWIQTLGKIARQRVIISAKANSIYLGRKNWKRQLYYSEDNSLFLRLYWCFDRLNHKLPQETI